MLLKFTLHCVVINLITERDPVTTSNVATATYWHLYVFVW